MTFSSLYKKPWSKSEPLECATTRAQQWNSLLPCDAPGSSPTNCPVSSFQDRLERHRPVHGCSIWFPGCWQPHLLWRYAFRCANLFSGYRYAVLRILLIPNINCFWTREKHRIKRPGPSSSWDWGLCNVFELCFSLFSILLWEVESLIPTVSVKNYTMIPVIIMMAMLPGADSRVVYTPIIGMWNPPYIRYKPLIFGKPTWIPRKNKNLTFKKIQFRWWDSYH